jgi:hypothetical protein
LLTLNQIHAQILALANAHYQIAEVGMGTIAELQGKPDRLYPLLWLSNEGGSLEDNYKVDNIRLTMFGRVIVGEEGQDDDASEIEVLSDMQLILLDFLNYFHQQHGQEYVTDKAATLEHFTERTNDRTAGYSCVLELKQFYDWNKCNIPQSGAVIPPTIDGLTLYDFCDQSVIDRLTATQVACLEAELCGTCADATVQLNGTTVGTIPSGDSDSFAVNLDGSPSGVWDGTAWQVTSTPCADATVELNGVEMTTIPSGDTENISIRQSSGATEVGSKQGVHWRIDDSAISINGSPVADVKSEDSLDIDVTQDGSPVGSWNGSEWVIPTVTGATLTVEVFSDAGYTTPITATTYNQTVYIRATPTGTTPTGYVFFAFDGTNIYPIGEQVGNEISGEVPFLGSYEIYVNALGVDSVYGSETLTGSSDPDALLYINAHNTASSLTMADAQQLVVNEVYAKFKGARTINNSNLWTKLSGDNAEIYPFAPVSNSVTSLPTIAVDMINPGTLATIVNFLSTDVEVDGVTASSTKWLVLKNQPSDFGQDDVGADVYYKTSTSTSGMYIGAYNGNMTNGVFFSPQYFGANNIYQNSILPRAIGLLSINRDNAANFQQYFRAVEIVSRTVASTAPPSLPFFGFATNRDGAPDTGFGRKFTGKLAMVANRSSFTDTELADWNEIWEYYTANIIL